MRSARVSFAVGRFSLSSDKTSPYSIEHGAPREAADLHGIPPAHGPWGAEGPSRPTAGAATSCAPSRAGADSGRVSGARHRAGAGGRSLPALAASGAGGAALARTGVRARRVQGRPLLAPADSRAPDRRGAGEGGARAGDEERGCEVGEGREPGVLAVRAGCEVGEGREPGVLAVRAGARREIPPPRTANTARGSERARLRAPERAEALGEGAAGAQAAGQAGRSELRPLVRRLAASMENATRAAGSGPAGSRNRADVATSCGMAKARPRGPERDAGHGLRGRGSGEMPGVA
jgi:hypothetical protein